MRKALQDYLPPILLQTIEFPLLCLAEQPEILLLLNAVDEVFENQFVETATEQAIRRYEGIFKIVPKDTQTLEERRIELLAKMNLRLPYTIRMLRAQLSKLCGADGFTSEIIPDKYQLTVSLPDRNKNHLPTIAALLRRMVPANIGITTTATRETVTTSVYMGTAQMGESSRMTLPLLEPEQHLTAVLSAGAAAGEACSRTALLSIEPDQHLTAILPVSGTAGGTASRVPLREP